MVDYQYEAIVAEDNPRIRGDICNLLRKQKIKVRDFGTIRQALPAVSNNFYDFLITDMSFKDGTGEELIQEAKQHNPRVPILVVSETASYDYNLIPSGATAFIPKRKAHGEVYVGGRDLLIALKKAGIEVNF